MPRSSAAALLLLAVLAVAGRAEDDGHRVWYAGAYSFSDELGGFRILGVSGEGTREAPYVVDQEFYSASPVTMVIRAAAPIRPFSTFAKGYASGFLYMEVVARNESGLAWTEFELELQEALGQPSVFSDGLSFDQRRTSSDNIAAEGFSTFVRDFEPYDRLRFRDGHLNPGRMARFSFLVSDFTPTAVFYLLQDPRIPAS